jgi:hypothetical protein
MLSADGGTLHQSLQLAADLSKEVEEVRAAFRRATSAMEREEEEVARLKT